MKRPVLLLTGGAMGALGFAFGYLLRESPAELPSTRTEAVAAAAASTRAPAKSASRVAAAPAPAAHPTAPIARPMVAPPSEPAAPPAPTVAAAPVISAASVRAALAEVDPVRRHLAFSDLLRGLNAQNARVIAQELAERGEDGRGRHELGLVMDAWGQVDGPAAVAYASELNSEQALNSALTGWAAQYPEAARQWALAREENPDNPWMFPVIAGAARSNVDAALPMLYALPYGAARGRSLDAVIEAYARRGVESLANWAQGISDQRLREGAVARVAPRLAAEQPRRAAEWAVKYAGEERLPQALIPVMAQWARNEPSEAVSWAEQLEAGRTRDLALEHAVSTWAWKDPAAAEAWLSRTAAGPSFDRARISIGMRYFESDPVRAMTWVSTVSDANLRNRMLERIAGAWSQRDPDAAAKFLVR